MSSAKPKFRPSATYQWLCPGSTNAIVGLPIGESSAVADRGSAIHGAVEVAMVLGIPRASAALPQAYADDGESVRIADEAHAEMLTLAAGVDTWASEVPLNIGAMIGAEFADNCVAGTADFVGYDEATRTLVVADIKTGTMFVPPTSLQLRLYAIGALGLHPAAETIVTVVVQPQCPDHTGSITHTHRFTRGQLRLEAAAFGEKIREAEEPNPIRTPGTHCHFCPALSICRPSAEYHLGAVTAAVNQNLGPNDLTDAELAEIVIKSGEVQALIQAVRQHATDRMIAGHSINRLKLVRGRGSRSWRDEDAALADLIAAGADPEIIAPRKLASPARAEAAGFKAITKSHVVASKGALKAAWVEAPGKAEKPPVAAIKDAFDGIETE